jgi:hypothetical protein
LETYARQEKISQQKAAVVVLTYGRNRIRSGGSVHRENCNQPEDYSTGFIIDYAYTQSNEQAS